MNDLARLMPIFFASGLPYYRITDREGMPWWVVKDICAILGRKNPSKAVRDFPPEEVNTVICDITSSYITSAKPRARKTQKVLIVNYSGAIRLISRSRKPEGRQLREACIKLQAAIFEQGFYRASLPKTWSFAGEENLTWNQWIDRREKAYFRKHPGATPEDFLKTLPNR